MRSFPIIFILIFLAIFLLTARGSFLNLKKIMAHGSFRKTGLFLFILLNVSVLIGFFILYIYPFNPRQATNYPVYFYFNTFLFAVFIFNLPMSLAWLMHVFFERKRQTRVFLCLGFIPAVGLAVILVYGTFAGSRELKTEEITLTYENLPEGFNGYRIVQISDFHLGGVLRPEKLLDRTQKVAETFAPDLILFTGDLVNNFSNETEGVEDIMRRISCVADSYSILGNHDYGDYTSWDSQAQKTINFEAIIESHRTMGFRLLNNTHVVLHRRADSIFLAGVENWGHPPFPQYADLEAALRNIPGDAFTLLMTHDPAHWESRIAGKEPVELTLSGHTHGMQWGIKLAGIPFSIAYLTRKTWGGLYGAGSQKLYVNTGIGTVGMPWRMDMPAEITCITLQRGEVNGK